MIDDQDTIIQVLRGMADYVMSEEHQNKTRTKHKKRTEGGNK